MRFMVMVKSDPTTDASGAMPDEKALTEMGRFNEELVKAGVMLAGEGLHPSAKGSRVRYDRGKVTVTDGPFTEAKELVAGFWIWQVRSKEDALEWARRIPFEHGEVEIRQVFESDEFGEAFTPELRAQEDRLRAEMAKSR